MFNHIQNNKWNNIIEKNVNACHFIIAKMFDIVVNSPLRGEVNNLPNFF